MHAPRAGNDQIGDAVIGSTETTLSIELSSRGDSDHDSDEEEDDEHDESNNGIFRSQGVLPYGVRRWCRSCRKVRGLSRATCTPRLAAVRPSRRGAQRDLRSTFEIDDPQSNGRLTSDIAAEALAQLRDKPARGQVDVLRLHSSATDQMTAAEKLDRRGAGRMRRSGRRRSAAPMPYGRGASSNRTRSPSSAWVSCRRRS